MKATVELAKSTGRTSPSAATAMAVNIDLIPCAHTWAVSYYQRQSTNVGPGLVTGFFFQHALQGWCPPLPILRRMGFRTSADINEERNALKALRGDFDQIISKDGKRADPEAAFVSAQQ